MADAELAITCDCGTRDHQVWFNFYDDGDDVMLFIEPKLNRKRTFRERLQVAFRYAFGLSPCAFGDFDDVMVEDATTARRIAEIATTFADKWEALRKERVTGKENGS